VSRLRARCPDCLTYTAVALEREYQCHSCGREFAAGLVRVPRAWGQGGDAMAEAAALPLAFPEAAVIEEATLREQTLALASELPERPLVLGGCCCAHVGAVEGLAARHGRLAVVWLDAHGDLNTPSSSPSGNEWGMPLRMLVDGGAVDATDVALVGARNLDPPEEEFIAASGLHTGPDAVESALRACERVYVALDVDVLEPSELSVFMPEPGGPSLAEVERLLGSVRERVTVLGAGFTGLRPDPASVPKLERLAEAVFRAGLS
jgi:arginase family enzyme